MELSYDTHLPMPASEGKGRVPSGLSYASIKAQMESLEVVFLSRFLFELLQYVQLLLLLKPDLAGPPAKTTPAKDSAPSAPPKVFLA